jgi:hypothetical protein
MALATRLRVRARCRLCLRPAARLACLSALARDAPPRASRQGLAAESAELKAKLAACDSARVEKLVQTNARLQAQLKVSGAIRTRRSLHFAEPARARARPRAQARLARSPRCACAGPRALGAERHGLRDGHGQARRARALRQQREQGVALAEHQQQSQQAALALAMSPARCCCHRALASLPRAPR